MNRLKSIIHLSSSLLYILSFLMLIPIIIAVVYREPANMYKSFIDAFFESVSGFTTTGITVFQGLDTMSPSMIFWRGFIQWLGGLGILTFFLFVTTKSEGDAWQLFSAEGHKISSARPVPNIYRTIKYFWAIYAAYTLIEIILLILLGLDFFEAMIHSFTTLSISWI